MSGISPKSYQRQRFQIMKVCSDARRPGSRLAKEIDSSSSSSFPGENKTPDLEEASHVSTDDSDNGEEESSADFVVPVDDSVNLATSSSPGGSTRKYKSDVTTYVAGKAMDFPRIMLTPDQATQYPPPFERNRIRMIKRRSTPEKLPVGQIHKGVRRAKKENAQKKTTPVVIKGDVKREVASQPKELTVAKVKTTEAVPEEIKVVPIEVVSEAVQDQEEPTMILETQPEPNELSVEEEPVSQLSVAERTRTIETVNRRFSARTAPHESKYQSARRQSLPFKPGQEGGQIPNGISVVKNHHTVYRPNAKSSEEVVVKRVSGRAFPATPLVKESTSSAGNAKSKDETASFPPVPREFIVQEEFDGLSAEEVEAIEQCTTSSPMEEKAEELLCHAEVEDKEHSTVNEGGKFGEESYPSVDEESEYEEVTVVPCTSNNDPEENCISTNESYDSVEEITSAVSIDTLDDTCPMEEEEIKEVQESLCENLTPVISDHVKARRVLDHLRASVVMQKRLSRKNLCLRASFVEDEKLFEEKEFDQDRSALSMTNPDHEDEAHNQVPWDEEDYEEIPWWDQPDFHDDDEVTALCKKVLLAGGRGQTGNFEIYADKIQGLIIKFVLQLTQRIKERGPEWRRKS